jgi:type I restriction enzyme, S subunit
MAKVELNDICKAIIDCEHKTAPTQDTGYPCIRTVNIGQGKLLLDGVSRVSEEVYSEWTRRAIPQTGDLILAREAPVGNVAMIPNDVKVCLGQRTVLIKPNKSAVNPSYLMYFLLSTAIQKRLTVLSAGGTVHHLNLKDIRGLKFDLLHTLAEQKAIAQILGTWDEAIATTEALIEALTLRKRALMQRLLTGEIRNDWQEYYLDEISEVVVSGVDKKSREDDIAVRLCNYMDVFYNNYITDDMDFMEATATEREIEKCKLYLDDVIITKDSETPEDIAQATVVIEQLTNVICGYHLAILKPNKEKVLGKFLRELIMIPETHYEFERKANGATRFGLTIPSIKKTKLSIPDLDTQKAITDLFHMSDKMTSCLETQIGHLQEQKRGLMQVLLTGQVRVGVAES